jgi:hypothetical protein
LSQRGFLLLRRGGGLWGIANASVLGLARRDGGGFEVTVDAGALVADEILGVVAELAVRRAAPVVRRFWPEASAGVAMYEEVPLVVVDPDRPPQVLRADLPTLPAIFPETADDV